MGSRFELYEPGQPKAAAGWSMSTVVEPNPLYGSNGIRMAPDGTLWITQVNGDQITAWDPRTGELTLADPMGSPSNGPDDVAFDSHGAWYVTETMNNVVSGKRDGEYVVLLDETVGPNGITVDSRDRVFVDEMSEGGRVLELDPSHRNRARVIAEGLDWLNALELGPDGRLYLPQVFAGRVLAVDPETGHAQLILDDLVLPVAVKFDASGALVVAQAGTGDITRFDLGTGDRRSLCAPGVSIDNFCFDSAGSLYTSNFVEARVEQWDPATGTLLATAAPGGLIGPNSIAAWDDRDLVVADHNSIIRVNPDGRLDRVTRLLGNQQFVASAAARISGRTVALTMAGEVVDVDPGTGAISRLVESTGSLTDQLLASGGGATAITVRGDRLLVGVDGDVIEMRADGSERTVHTFGFDSVSAVSAGDGRIAAADAESGVIAVRTEHGTSAWEGFAQPEAVAVTSDAVFVVETGRRTVTRVGRDGARSIVAHDVPVGMPRESARLGRTASLFARDDSTVLLGCDGDGSIRMLRAR
jgi:sugar lactone lactonase YvrE